MSLTELYLSEGKCSFQPSLKGLCHGFLQIFEQPKFIFVSEET